MTFEDEMKYCLTMKMVWVISILTFICFLVLAGPAPSKAKEAASRLSTYEGKHFVDPQDPSYKEYDTVLREHLIRRIHKRFGIEFDPKSYSGFDLLEIESLLKIKKSNEPLDPFLKMFPKTR